MVQKLSLGFGHKLIFQQDETNFVKIINKSGQVTQEWKSEQWRDLPEVTMSEILHSIFLTHYPLPSVPKRIAPNNNTIKHLKEISIEEFLSHICDSRYKQINSDGKKIVNIKEYQISRYMQPSKTYKVRVYSQRYLVFKNNLTCVVCGLKGEKVYLDQEKKNCNNAHFNLYGVENGQLVLMTKDHIIPKARGGKNYLQNYQTMCCICNNLKSNTQLDNNRIFQMRQQLGEQCTQKVIE